MIKRLLIGLFYLLSLVAIGMYAHEAYSSLKNQQNKQLHQHLLAGDYHLDWPLNSTEQWISAFGTGWQWQQRQLQINPHQAAVSLRFNDRHVYPAAHGTLRFNWHKLNHQKNQSSQVLLEFSQADSGLFYYAPWLPVTEGDNVYDLQTLRWHLKVKGQSDVNGIAWQHLPPLNTLVLRFRNQNKDMSGYKVILKNIRIVQTHPLNNAKPLQILPFNLTNSMRYQLTKLNQQQVQALQIQRYSNLPPIVWLVLAVGLLLVSVVMVTGKSAASRLQISFLVWLIAGCVWILQQADLAVWLEQKSWLLLAPMVVVVVLSVRRWWRPKTRAAPIILTTLLVALVLWFAAGFKLLFISTLPVYLLWAFCQQVLIGPVVSDWLQQNYKAQPWLLACFVGALFAWLHSPNQMLMMATFFGGVFWSWSWLRYRNIYINSICHALWALLFYQAMPDMWLGSARIGLWF